MSRNCKPIIDRIPEKIENIQIGYCSLTSRWREIPRRARERPGMCRDLHVMETFCYHGREE